MFYFPVLHTIVCLVAGAASFVESLLHAEPPYDDVYLFNLLNPIALYLFHAKWWFQLYPLAIASYTAHFLGLPVLIGIVGGWVYWAGLGLFCDLLQRPHYRRQVDA